MWIRGGRWRRSRSAMNLREWLLPHCFGQRGGPFRHPELASLGDAARHVPQLHVQMLGRASQEVECVLRGDLESLHQDSFGLADDVSGEQGLLQVAAEALQGAAFIHRPGRHRGVRGQNKSNLLRSVAERIRLDSVGVQDPPPESVVRLLAAARR